MIKVKTTTLIYTQVDLSILRIKFCVSLMFLSSCSLENEIQKFPNPFNDAFQGSNIKILVALNELNPEFNDSLFFDREGRLIQQKIGWVTDKYQYDSNSFLTREYYKSDAMGNYLNKLVYDNNHVYQYKIPINSWNWDYTYRDVDTLFDKKNRRPDWAYDTTVFILYQGYVRSLIYNGKFFERFIYSESDKLICRVHIHNRYKTEYFYNKNDKLKEIVYSEFDSIIWRKYFTSGLLDSIRGRYGDMSYYTERHYWN